MAERRESQATLEERRAAAIEAERRAAAQPAWKQGAIVFSECPARESLPDLSARAKSSPQPKA